jgi:hypothetical protein
MMADHNCEQAGYQLGTPQYADCRMEELARRADANAAAMQAFRCTSPHRGDGDDTVSLTSALSAGECQAL